MNNGGEDHSPVNFDLTAEESCHPSLRSGSDSLDAEILRFAQDDNQARQFKPDGLIMDRNKYLPTTWYAPGIEIRPSPIQGNGMFAARPFQECEVVVIIGGRVMSDAEFRAFMATVPRFNAIQIGEDAHLVDIPTSPGGMNHSCDANLWMRDEVTVVARRDITAGEELTQDYALYTTHPDWAINHCRCGSSVCRHVVTGNDWQRKDVQERYKGHFSPFINERIKRLHV